MSDCDCGFEIDDRVKFAGGEGEIAKIAHRPTGQCLLTILTEVGKEKRPSAVVEKAETSDSLLAKQTFDTQARFNLRTQAAELDLAHRQDRFVAIEGNRIDITPYQVKAAYEILTSYDHRYLIGDEVGLGKTIEAAIVIEELAARGRADRVLIIAPAPLTTQWQEELREKFDRESVIYDRKYVSSMRQAHPSKNVWTHDDYIITSIDFAKQDDMLAALKNVEEDWDLVIIDEAHHLTARRDGKFGKIATDRYRVGEVVSDRSDGLIFLTGTPHNGKRDQFYFMISLLDPYRFKDENDVHKEGLQDLMIRRLKDEMYESDGSKMFPEKNIQTLPVTFTPTERSLYEDVTTYITENYNLANREDNETVGFAMVLYQKRLVSSIYAIRQSLKNRLESIRAGDTDPKDLSQVVRSLLTQYREDPSMLTDAQREKVESEIGSLTSSQDTEKIQKELEIVRGLYNRAKAIDVDSKAEALREFCDGILNDDPDEKILIFTEYTDTLEYLRDRIFVDHDVAQVYGDLPQQRRQQELAKFENHANIMLATDAAREGLNLQFAHIMVNYDLPWNPTRIDQRIGRLHRYGQKHTVQIRNLFIENTRESDILELLMEKLEEIEETLGLNSDVLGLVLDDIDIEEQIMTAIVKGDTADEIKHNIDHLVDDQKEAVRRIDEELLIRDRFDLSNEDKEILDIIERSSEETVSESDIETLVRTVCSEFGGRIVNRRRGPDPDGGDVFDLVVPDQLSGTDVKGRYNGATFSRKNAIKDTNLEFISLDHPVVRSMMAFCLDTDRVGGQTAILTGGTNVKAPGLLCHFRIGYLSGTGEVVTERLIHVYVPVDGSATMVPIQITGGIRPADAEEYPEVTALTQAADRLLSDAEEIAWDAVDQLAEDAQRDREREARIREDHTINYFQHRIDQIDDRIDRLRNRETDSEEARRLNIARAENEIKELEQQEKEEIDRLAAASQVIPDEPELINMAVVIDAFQQNP